MNNNMMMNKDMMNMMNLFYPKTATNPPNKTEDNSEKGMSPDDYQKLVYDNLNRKMNNKSDDKKKNENKNNNQGNNLQNNNNNNMNMMNMFMIQMMMMNNGNMK
jgi:hypothetical protein